MTTPNSWITVGEYIRRYGTPMPIDPALLPWHIVRQDGTEADVWPADRKRLLNKAIARAVQPKGDGAA